MNALQVLLTICRRILLRTSFAVALGIGLPASTQASDQAELNSAPFPASDITKQRVKHRPVGRGYKRAPRSGAGLISPHYPDVYTA